MQISSGRLFALSTDGKINHRRELKPIYPDIATFNSVSFFSLNSFVYFNSKVFYSVYLSQSMKKIKINETKLLNA